ncbi:MAG: AarF/ABC1/UbiB kinase family protein, partial [Proteobacteria bacterium]|nr:AarF/ABC1/UbiB kinase family protein [Pseudomonadota bacterium]
MIHQLLVDGFFHGDPHPGNVFVNLDDAQIIFLDTGMMGRLAEDQRTGIINLLKALRNSDAVEIVRIAMTIGVIHKPVDQRALRRDIDRLLNRYLSAALSDIPFAEVLSKILILIFNRGIRLPSELTLALKALIQTEEIARTLNPEIQVADVTQTLTKHLFMEQLKPETIMARFNSGIAELFQLAPQFYGAISQLLKQVQSGKLTVELDASDLPRQLQEFTVIANRFTIGLTLAGMTVGSA